MQEKDSHAGSLSAYSFPTMVRSISRRNVRFSDNLASTSLPGVNYWGKVYFEVCSNFIVVEIVRGFINRIISGGRL